MDILLIGNPISSGGNAGKRIKQLAQKLENRGHQVTAYLTQFAGDGKAKIDSLSQGKDCVVVVGGDGTLNEIAGGISNPKNCSILHYPTGNANILSKDLMLPQRLSKVVKLIEQQKTVLADMGTMNGHKFLMVCGMGFDARVTEEVKKKRKGKVSNISYVLPFLRAINPNSGPMLHVDIDDGEMSAKGKAVLVCNVRNYGGICHMAYDAGVDTGVLDVVVFPRENLSALLSYLIYAKFSRITRLKDVVYLKASKNVTVRSDEPIPVELDGDFFERHNQVGITIHKGFLPLIVP